MRTRRTALVVASLGLAGAALVFPTQPAAAQETTPPTTRQEETDPDVRDFFDDTDQGDAFSVRNPVVIGQDIHVRQGESISNLLVINGRAVIEGTVDGAVFAIRSPVLVTGTVNAEGDAADGNAIVSWGRRVTLGPTAVVQGDIWSNLDLNEAPGATFDGEYHKLGPTSSLDEIWRLVTFVFFLFMWATITASLLALGFLLIWLTPRAIDRAYEAGRTAIGPSIGWGLFTAVVVPVVATILVATLLGLPLGLWVLGAWSLIFAVGYVVAGYFVGRLVLRNVKGRSGPWLLGWAIFAAVSFVPVLNAIVWTAATVYGTGMLTVALWRARYGRVETIDLTAPTTEGPVEDILPASSEGAPPPEAGVTEGEVTTTI
ncbi:MAG: polymer-forming cytoskeletal protein [Acidimicrobiia bacterium]|nr:polymer-forming cytoskeletal protein [Acidimicrobiia bacterium]